MTTCALIVAHGQPSDPDPAEQDVAALGARVAERLPGWRMDTATLAAPGALGRAMAALDRPLIFPFFMADGWFIRDLLPRRIADTGHEAGPVLTPFGLLPATAALAGRILHDAAGTAGWDPAATTVILAAHGSGRSPHPAEAARALENHLRADGGFAAIRTGFVEQSPSIAEAARGAGAQSLCLPLFVARWGHVRDDIPAGLSEAGFAGRLLAPLGCHGAVPDLIAGALRDAAVAGK
ncbi:MAG: cobalamin biosynthesis protein CbiX [Rhodobacteraceae bacterium]|nr:cobalamin biosynthesis protein CbiX [Paracoccaceae bacterium]